VVLDRRVAAVFGRGLRPRLSQFLRALFGILHNARLSSYRLDASDNKLTVFSFLFGVCGGLVSERVCKELPLGLGDRSRGCVA
jgi:hypothetical protein